MYKHLILIPGIILAGCTAVKVVDTPPPSDQCEQLGVISATAQDEQESLRRLERDVGRLGGNVLFPVVNTETRPEAAAVEPEPGVTRYAMAFRCNLLGLK